MKLPSPALPRSQDISGFSCESHPEFIGKRRLGRDSFPTCEPNLKTVQCGGRGRAGFCSFSAEQDAIPGPGGRSEGKRPHISGLGSWVHPDLSQVPFLWGCMKVGHAFLQGRNPHPKHTNGNPLVALQGWKASLLSGALQLRKSRQAHRPQSRAEAKYLGPQKGLRGSSAEQVLSFQARLLQRGGERGPSPSASLWAVPDRGHLFSKGSRNRISPC